MGKIYEFFDGFTWAVPTAFADALASCRFEQGDMLYDTRKAYEGSWGEALPHITYSLQVNSPARGIGTKKDIEEESVFTDNWNMTVEFTITYHKKNKTKKVTSTQGRLYSLLWKGDLDCIDNNTPSPSEPTLAMQIVRNLPQAIQYVRNSKGKKDTHDIVFLMPYDQTRQLLRLKLQRVQDSLRDFKTQTSYFSPVEAGLQSNNDFAPTVSIACFCIKDTAQITVEDALKKALYTPSKDKKTEIDRYRITAHGYIERI